MIVSLIPFFLAVLLPIDDVQNGPEYIFTVRMNLTETPQCPRQITTCGDPNGHEIIYRLHCIPKRNDTLICTLNYVNHTAYGTINEDTESKYKNMTDMPMELLFNEDGIKSIITNQKTHPFNLNILRTIIELLNPGSNFDDTGNGTFEDAPTSIIGKCTATFNVHHNSNKETEAKFPDDTRLKLLPSKLDTKDTLVIEKTMNLNDCSYYADYFFGRYGDRIIHKDLKTGLDSMISRMEISETSFSSSTTKKETTVFENKIYNIIEFSEMILTDIKLTASEPPTIMNPGRTRIVANDYVTSID